MKRLMMVAALAVAQSGCASSQEDAPVLFSNVLALAGSPGGACEPDTSKFISQGSLDVAGGDNYVMAVRVRSTIPAARTILVGDTPTLVGGESITLTEFVYRYESSPELGLPDEDRAATNAVIPAGTTGDSSYVPVNAFGPLALEKLLTATPGEPGVSVIVYIKARGRVGSTSNAESNEFSFPVRVFRSLDCSSNPVTAGICSFGQDVRTACPPPTFAPTTP
ncbi:hypothetical protein CYFUS_008030 [Cystobacter fuscus]|uniref:Lipoprotein n=1 Tax=Cystobacter fuscus TaxID=43 RepID=A0A250JGL2_9BACT|nr:hypothetical protein [Cystobacter fuscus]ATB42551.1 hypothetical protein CYFUS_008030 [Cystobacter fuscus]